MYIMWIYILNVNKEMWQLNYFVLCYESDDIIVENLLFGEFFLKKEKILDYFRKDML